MKDGLAAACGLYCGDCEHLGERCPGCAKVGGKPFWVSQVGLDMCRMYKCSVIDKRLAHCGQCEQLPCELFAGSWDPSLSDEEGKENVRQRVTDLLRRKEIGTESWLKDRGTG